MTVITEAVDGDAGAENAPGSGRGRADDGSWSGVEPNNELIVTPASLKRAHVK